LFVHQNPPPLSVLHHPRPFPASPNQSLKPSTTAFAIPCRLLFLSPDDPVRLLGSSLPIVGRTLSLADRLTNSAKGTSQTQRPKNEEISVKVGKLLVSYLERGGTRGTEKCLNQRKWLRRTRTTQGRQRVQLLTCNFRNEKCLPQDVKNNGSESFTTGKRLMLRRYTI